MAGLSVALPDAPWGVRALDGLGAWVGAPTESPDDSRPGVLAVAAVGHLIDQIDEVLTLRQWPEPAVRFLALAQHAVGCELRAGDQTLLIRMEADGRWRLLQADGDALRASPRPEATLELDAPWTVPGTQPLGQFGALVPWLQRLLADG